MTSTRKQKPGGPWHNLCNGSSWSWRRLTTTETQTAKQTHASERWRTRHKSECQMFPSPSPVTIAIKIKILLPCLDVCEWHKTKHSAGTCEILTRKVNYTLCYRCLFLFMFIAWIRISRNPRVVMQLRKLARRDPDRDLNVSNWQLAKGWLPICGRVESCRWGFKLGLA